MPFEDKSQQVKNLIEAVFPGTLNAIANRKRPICKNAIGEFRDRISQREYEISGLCQNCQDEIFSGADF